MDALKTPKARDAAVRQFAIAATIGFGSAAVVFLAHTCSFFLLGRVLQGTVLTLSSGCVLAVLCLVAAYSAGRALARKVDRRLSFLKIVLATPGFFGTIALFVISLASRRIDDETLGALLAQCSLILLSAALTASGFYFSPHWRYVKNPHICRACDYDLRGNVSGTCPECGTVICAEQRGGLATGLSADTNDSSFASTRDTSGAPDK